MILIFRIYNRFKEITGVNRMAQAGSKKTLTAVQQGWMVDSFQRVINQFDSPSKLVYGTLIVLLIAYSSEIPQEYHSFADSLLGRVFGIAIVYGVLETMGWVYGLLTALAFLLLLTGAHRTLQEGFDGGGSVSEKRTVGKRWFVEKVLGEYPSKIATDQVTTAAVTD
jgi:hypothetical protein